jgi:DNA-directed RNA polymerase sigma subunit (sigma70/sigma32)
MVDDEFDRLVAGFDGFLVDEQVHPEAKTALGDALRTRLAGKEPPRDVDSVVVATADEVVSRLNDTEHAVVRLRYGFDARGPMSLEQVAKVLGKPTSEVARTESHARWKLNPRWGHE